MSSPSTFKEQVSLKTKRKKGFQLKFKIKFANRLKHSSTRWTLPRSAKLIIWICTELWILLISILQSSKQKTFCRKRTEMVTVDFQSMSSVIFWYRWCWMRSLPLRRTLRICARSSKKPMLTGLVSWTLTSFTVVSWKWVVKSARRKSLTSSQSLIPIKVARLTSMNSLISSVPAMIWAWTTPRMSTRWTRSKWLVKLKWWISWELSTILETHMLSLLSSKNGAKFKICLQVLLRPSLTRRLWCGATWKSAELRIWHLNNKSQNSDQIWNQHLLCWVPGSLLNPLKVYRSQLTPLNSVVRTS